jgi:hypothetical protein
MKTHNPLIMGATLSGFLAILSSLVDWRVGLIFAALAATLIVVAVRQARKSRKPAEQTRSQLPIQTISSRFDAQPVEDALPASLPLVPRPEGNSDLGQLLAALRMKGINVRAPVVFAGNDALTVQHIVAEVAMVARTADMDISVVAARMDQVYELMWEYAGPATTSYDTLEKIRAHIAAQSLLKAMEEEK